jgi:hypothetical protein
MPVIHISDTVTHEAHGSRSFPMLRVRAAAPSCPPGVSRSPRTSRAFLTA